MSITSFSGSHLESNPEGGPDLSSLTAEQLAELGNDAELIPYIRTEVYRRLESTPQKANFLTFRWLLPKDTEDQADAFEGLMATSWNAAKKRHVITSYKKPSPSERSESCDYFELDAIIDELVNRLYALKDLSFQEIIRTALDLGFETDANVANAVRRRVLQERKNRPLDMNKEADRKEIDKTHFRKVDFLYESATSRPNPYKLAVDFIESRETEIKDVIGETGWEILWTFVDLIDNDLCPDGKRDRERVLTEAIASKRGVSTRQARTDKEQLRTACGEADAFGNPVFKRVIELLTRRRQR